MLWALMCSGQRGGGVSSGFFCFSLVIKDLNGNTTRLSLLAGVSSGMGVQELFVAQQAPCLCLHQQAFQTNW